MPIYSRPGKTYGTLKELSMQTDCYSLDAQINKYNNNDIT